MTPDQQWSIQQRMHLQHARARTAFVARPPFPQNIMIELSNACNHACVFCANPKMTRRRGLIDRDLLRSILRQARSLGAREAGFYTTGDPFVHSELEAVVRHAKELGFEYTYVSTNGALATPERSKAVIDAGLDSMKFSINAGTRETYRAIHGRDDWDRVIANLRFVSAYRRTLGRTLRLAITYVVTRQNRHEVEPFRAQFREMVDDIHFSQCDNQQGNMQENLEWVASESAPEATATPFTAPCYMVFSRAHVTCEGYLTLCCVDYQNYLAVADLRTMTLEEAWSHPRFVEMRERHLRNQLQGTLCWNCIHQRQDPIQPLVTGLATPVDFAQAARSNIEVQRRRLGSSQAGGSES